MDGERDARAQGSEDNDLLELIVDPQAHSNKEFQGLETSDEQTDGQSECGSQYADNPEEKYDQHSSASDHGSGDNTASDNNDSVYDDVQGQEEDSDIGNGDCQSVTGDPEVLEPESNTKTRTRKRRKLPANAKEFFARKLAKRDAKHAVPSHGKRKSSGTDNPRPPKLAKHNDLQHDESNDIRAKLINGVGDDFETAFASGDAPSMGTITASTHKAQLEQIKASIPKGCDLRRATSQLKDVKEAKKVFGYKKIVAHNGTWLLKGMKTGVFHYQLTLAAWMAGRECGYYLPPFGGLVADEMGMGKTIVSLFLIHGNPPSEEEIEEHCQATLVVVPNATIAKQWQKEVQTHGSPETSKKTAIFNRSREPDKEFYEEQVIVITTYNEVLSQWFSREKMKSLQARYGEDKDGLKKELKRNLGPLYEINWYRIILDEAHQIKNLKAQTTQACCYLNAKFRWGLSGTPLANTAEEFFPYFQFLGCSYTENLKTFRDTYINGHEAQKKLETLVSYIMYRRTKKDEFAGSKILEVPNCTVLELRVPLSKEETTLSETIISHYEAALRNKSRTKDKKKSEAFTQKEIDDKLAIVRAMHMKERQTCSHLFNLESWLRSSCSMRRVVDLEEDLRSNGGTKTLLDQLLDASPEWLKQFPSGLAELKRLNSPTLSGCINIVDLLNCIVNEKRMKRESCPLCKANPPRAPTFARHCGHVYCEQCLLKERRKSSSRTRCVFTGCKSELDIGQDIETLDTAIDGVANKYAKKAIQFARDSNKVILKQEKNQSGMFTTSEVNPELHTPPSTKLLVAMLIILDWQKNHPDDKIIVFTTFIGTAKILGRMLNIAKIHNFLYYYGCVTQVKKDKAIEQFQESPEKKILIMGLKCGALGLNLTTANRVIIVDPWWNNTVEHQAFGRVWRYKQTKLCHLVRIKSDSAIDEKIAGLQDIKSGEINRALQDEGFFPTEVDDDHVRSVFCKDDEGDMDTETVE